MKFVNPKAARLTRLMRLLAASVAALVTLAVCQLAICVLQVAMVRPKPVDLFGHAGFLEVVGELVHGGGADFGVGDVIDAAQGLFGVPGVADLAVGVSGVEQAAQLGVSVVGDALRCHHEELAGPVEGVVLVAAVSQRLVLDSAADLVEGVVAQPHDVERVRDLSGLGQRRVERGAVGAREGRMGY